jgi:aminoglycoside 6'-N-acetyltransferase I
VSVEIRILRAGDERVLDRVLADVFDAAIDARGTAAFLADPHHHLAVAIDGGAVVGFATGNDYAHPDRAAPDLWINEVSVAPAYRERGIGKELVGALLDDARALGSREAWVGTEHDNMAARRLYQSLGGDAEDFVMFTFDL